MKTHPTLVALLVIATASLVTISSCAKPVSPLSPEKLNSAEYRYLSIPKEEWGYSNFRTTIFRSDEELSLFLAGLDSQPTWDLATQRSFVETLENAQLNLSEEVLILVRDTRWMDDRHLTLVSSIVSPGELACIVTASEDMEAKRRSGLARFRCFGSL